MNKGKMISKIDIRDDINEAYGFGEILIGMNIFYFQQIFDESKKHNSRYKNDWKLRIHEKLLFFVFLEYRKYFELSFNAVIGKLCGITYKEGYKGKLWNRITPGVKVKYLLKHSPFHNYEIIDGILVFPQQTNILFNIESNSYGADCPEYDEIKDKKIFEIIIRSELGYYNSLYGDIPELWAKSRPDEIGIKTSLSK
jgi:hypothetical protein